ncbi:MAG TPA: DivIVA domain-containing protein [Actinomycetota bacterium]|jgi:DivIVA domain-containing protein|nr:DivIVA domain-containing protein [Actinomycetota bacterium]
MTDERTEAPAASIMPADIQKQEFGVSRFGGYRMRDVDEFLDRLTASTESLIAENDRLRSGSAPIVGTPDLDDVNRQADEILQRAREQAARIVAEANANATPTAAEGSGDRPAVDAFLQQERTFLQDLAGLVQGHAESVKAMARKTRQPADAPPMHASAPSQPPAVSQAARTDEPATPDVADAGADEDGPGRHADTEAVSAGAGNAGDETVVIEVPQPAAAPGGGERDVESGDPSLKKLFWGEER